MLIHKATSEGGYTFREVAEFGIVQLLCLGSERPPDDRGMAETAEAAIEAIEAKRNRVNSWEC